MGFIYLFIGVCLATIDHFALGQVPTNHQYKGAVALDIAQRICHLFRVVLTWPLYLAEDLIIILSNRLYVEEE